MLPRVPAPTITTITTTPTTTTKPNTPFDTKKKKATLPPTMLHRDMEALQQENRQLKLALRGQKQHGVLLQTKALRLEGQLKQRDKQVEVILASNERLAAALSTPVQQEVRKIRQQQERSTAIKSLQHELQTLRAQVQEKDAQLRQLSRSHKALAVTELTMERDAYLAEVVRLRETVQELSVVKRTTVVLESLPAQEVRTETVALPIEVGDANTAAGEETKARQNTFTTAASPAALPSLEEPEPPFLLYPRIPPLPSSSASSSPVLVVMPPIRQHIYRDSIVLSKRPAIEGTPLVSIDEDLVEEEDGKAVPGLQRLEGEEEEGEEGGEGLLPVLSTGSHHEEELGKDKYEERKPEEGEEDGEGACLSCPFSSPTFERPQQGAVAEEEEQRQKEGTATIHVEEEEEEE